MKGEEHLIKRDCSREVSELQVAEKQRSCFLLVQLGLRAQTTGICRIASTSGMPDSRQQREIYLLVGLQRAFASLLTCLAILR